MKDIKNYRSESKSLGSGQVLHCAYTYDKTRIVVREMAEALALDLFQKKLLASSITLHVGYDVETLNRAGIAGDSLLNVDIVKDYYGRLLPKPAHGSISFDGAEKETNSSERIVRAAMTIFENVVNPAYLIRRINIVANNTIPLPARQPGLFDELLDSKKEDSLQTARLSIIQKFGKNALLKGMDFEEGATTRDRNAQIGGHRA